MKDETAKWLQYADENLLSARVLLENRLFNPCLQSVQQSVEKFMKTLLVERTMPLKRTNSINELKAMLSEEGIHIDLSEDECDLLDSIYLPSKYPLGGALPNFEPDIEICQRCCNCGEGKPLCERAFSRIAKMEREVAR